MEIAIPKVIEQGGDIVTTLNRLIDDSISMIHTTSIGIIESFDPESQTATIQPAIKRVIATEEGLSIVYTSENIPLLVNVPIVFQGGGDWFLTFPVKQGDECIIFSMERSIGNWKKNGGLQDPSHFRRKLSFKDAVAMVGIQSKASSLPNFNDTEPEIRNRDGNVKLTMGSEGMTLTGNLVVTGSLEVASGNFTVDV